RKEHMESLIASTVMMTRLWQRRVADAVEEGQGRFRCMRLWVQGRGWPERVRGDPDPLDTMERQMEVANVMEMSTFNVFKMADEMIFMMRPDRNRRQIEHE